MKLNFEVNGKDVEWDEGTKKLVEAIGFVIEGSIVEKITQLRLVDTGRFRASIHSYIKGKELIIADGVKYGKYLEFGTRHIQPYAPFRKGIISSLPRLRRLLNNTPIKKEDISPAMKEIKSAGRKIKKVTRFIPKVR